MPDRHQIWHIDREYESNGDVWLPNILDLFDEFKRNSNLIRYRNFTC